MKLILLFIFSALTLFPQNELKRWDKAEFSYALNKEEKRNYSINADDAGEFILKGTAVVYWTFISDVDGDNCPFNPTCSTFLISSVKRTNLFQGTLMFFDRFTRDMNLFERRKHYPVIKNGRFYDPPELYTLDFNTTSDAMHNER